jgi:hypothetical protein
VAGSIVMKKDGISISIVFKHSSIEAAVIQAFLLFLQMTGKLLIFIFLKHLSFAAFPVMRGVSISPTILSHNNNVSLSLDILPLVHISPLSVSDVVGNTRKNNPVSSTL